jgi:hypothetical protein
MKKTLLTIIGIAALSASSGFGQLILNNPSGQTFTENFDSLISSGSATWIDNSTITGWYAQRTGTGTTIVANDGSSNAGALYSYGGTGTTDRALGSVGSQTVGSIAWGVQILNNTGVTMTIDTISYVGEQWRYSGTAAAQTVTFWYRTSSSIITSLDPGSDSGWTALTSLDFTSPIISGTAGALNGNLPANQVSLSANNLAINLAAGEYIMFRWRDIDHPGSDHGLAIDNFSLTAAPIPEPSTYVLIALGLGGLILARRWQRSTKA